MEQKRDNTARASQCRTRLQSKLQAQKEQDRAQQSQGLSQPDYWKKYVHSEADVIKFYSIYYPDYPECLVLSISQRISGIIAKSHSGNLTEEDILFVQKSQQPSTTWNPLEELKEHEDDGKLVNTVKKLEQMMFSSSEK